MSTTLTPAELRQALAAHQQRIRSEIEARMLAARRRDTARNGYRGPLTRAELAAQAAERTDREHMRAILYMA